VHGLCWRENTNISKSLFIFSLALGTSNHVMVDVVCFHSYNMGDKIRRMRMNVAFEYIYKKEWSYLTYGRTSIMYQTLHDYDYLPRIRYAIFWLIWSRL
jgi:hypothetical protein